MSSWYLNVQRHVLPRLDTANCMVNVSRRMRPFHRWTRYLCSDQVSRITPRGTKFYKRTIDNVIYRTVTRASSIVNLNCAIIRNWTQSKHANHTSVWKMKWTSNVNHWIKLKGLQQKLKSATAMTRAFCDNIIIHTCKMGPSALSLIGSLETAVWISELFVASSLNFLVLSSSWSHH